MWGLGFGVSNGFVMHEFEELLARLLGGASSVLTFRDVSAWGAAGGWHRASLEGLNFDYR